MSRVGVAVGWIAILGCLAAVGVWVYSFTVEYTLIIEGDPGTRVEVGVSGDAPWVTYSGSGSRIAFHLNDIDYWEVTLLDADGSALDREMYRVSERTLTITVRDGRLSR